MSHPAGDDIRVSYRRWASGKDFGTGTFDGTTVTTDMLQLQEPVGVVDYTDPFSESGPVPYEVGRWLSPVVGSSAGFDELVASWNARTPPGTWIEVSVGVWPVAADPESAPDEFVLGRWAEDTDTIHRTSVPQQRSAVAQVGCDVIATAPDTSIGAWQLTVSCHRLRGSTATPTVSMVGAMTSPAPIRTDGSHTCPPRSITARTLAVPSYSQMVHRGRYPQYDNGGEAWCSPTSTAMVLAYWRRGPTPADYAWVDESYPDKVVAHAAAGTFDHAYGGAGNWSFNAAYAARFGLIANVTRLLSLDEAELFIESGIPLVASVSFAADELTGAGYPTHGHLLVIVGFTSSGDVVVNDPASHLVASNDEVRVEYDRTEFERVWLTRSGGLVYVIRPPDIPLPAMPPGTDPHW